MRIVFINKDSSGGSKDSIFPDVIAELERRGAQVDDVVPERELYDMQALDTSADLYVLRTRSTVGLNLAAALDIAGAPMLISFANERALRNKFLLHQRLIEAGIPTPRSYLLWKPEQVRDLLAERGPLVVKPHEGHGGAGVQVVRTDADLEKLDGAEGPLFAQEYKEGDGADLKLYGVGDDVSGIRRVFPARTPEEKRGEAFEPDEEMVRIARRCDEILGLGLYGVDLIRTSEGLFVIDINSVPGYKGIDGAAARVAAYVYDRAAASGNGEGGGEASAR